MLTFLEILAQQIRLTLHYFLNEYEVKISSQSHIKIKWMFSCKLMIDYIGIEHPILILNTLQGLS